MKDSIINALNNSNVEFTSGPYRASDLWIKCEHMFAYVFDNRVIVGVHGADFMACTECHTVEHAMQLLVDKV